MRTSMGSFSLGAAMLALALAGVAGCGGGPRRAPRREREDLQRTRERELRELEPHRPTGETP